MKLHEIINDILSDKIVCYQQIYPYKRSLITYLKDYWCTNEIYFIATAVSNAVQAGYVCSGDDIGEVIHHRAWEDSREDDNYEEIEELYSHYTQPL